MGTLHSEILGDVNHAITANPNSLGSSYADITARDADSSFNTATTNLNKVVRVEDADGSGNVGYFILVSVVPLWLELSSVATTDAWTDLTDTPSSITANLIVQGNSGGTALEFGQDLTLTGAPSLAGLTIEPATAVDAGLTINDSASVERLSLVYDVSLDEILMSTATGALAIKATNGTTGDLLLDGTVDADLRALTGTLNLFAGTQIDITTTSGDINVSSGAGDLTLAATLGDVTISSGAGTTTLQAGSGSLKFLEDGNSYNMHVGTASPVSVKTGDPGDLFIRVSTTTSSLYMHRGSVTGTAGWEEFDTGSVSATGTPLDNQLAVWADATTVEGTTALTFDGAQLLTADGTELLPSYSFVSDPDTGMRRVSADVLGFSAKGFDVLRLSADALSVNFLSMTASAADDELLLVTEGTDTDVSLIIDTQGAGSITLGQSSGEVVIWTTTGVVATAMFEAGGGVSLGRGLGSPSVSDGQACLIQADDTQTQSKLVIRQELSGGDINLFDLVVNSTGQVTIEAVSGTDIFLVNTAGTVASFTSLNTVLAGDLQVAGAFLDSTGSPGTSAQVLSSTVTGTDWVDAAGDVSISGTPLVNEIAVWTDSSTIEGTIGLMYDDNVAFDVNGGINLNDISGTGDGFNQFISFGPNYGNTAIMLFDASTAQRMGFGVLVDDLQTFVPDTTDRFTWHTGGDLQLAGVAELMRLSGTGDLSIGVTTASAKIHVLGTTEQLRLGFDATNFVSLTVSSGGDLTIAPSGADTGITGDLTVTGGSYELIPDNLELVGTISSTSLENAAFVFVLSGYAYVLANNGLVILDVAEVTSPVIISTLIDAVNMDNPRRVFVSGRFAYVVASGSDSLAIVDISDPSTPVVVGSLLDSTNLDDVRGVFVAGRYAYLASRVSDNLAIVDISDPTNPTLVSSLFDTVNMADARGVYVQGTYVYVTGLTNGTLNVIDISDPTAPVSVGTLTTGSGMIDLVVRGRYAYISGDSGFTIEIVDISDPSTPVLTGAFVDLVNLDGVQGIAVAGDYAYLAAAANNGITVVDISDPSSPTLLTFISDAATMLLSRGVTVVGKYAYVTAVQGDSLSIIDINGIDVATANIGNIVTDNLSVGGNVTVASNLATGSANVGYDMLVGGEFAVGGDTSLLGAVEVIVDIADSVPLLTVETTGTNGGTSSTFVGDQDPDGTVTGAGGDEYIRDAADLSGTFESREATTGTTWLKRSVNPGNVFEITSTAEFEALATAGVITITEDTTIILKAAVTTASVFNVTGGDLMITGQYVQGTTIIYTGTGTFITTVASGNSDVRITARARLVASSGGILFACVAASSTTTITIQDTTIQGWDLGSVETYTFLIVNTAFVFYGAPFVLMDVGLFATDTLIFIGGRLFQVDQGPSTSTFSTHVIGINASALSAPPMRIDPGLTLDVEHSVNIFNVSDGSIDFFDTSGGSTGTYTAVADNAISATAITSVTDNSGVAVFNHAGSSPLLGSTVTISGFTTNTDYNGDFFVTLTTSTTFECEVISFGSTETGSYLVNAVTLTSTAHGLSFSDGVTLSDDLAADYDGGYRIYNIQTNSFDVAATFVATQTGTWDTAGVGEDNPQVLAFLGVRHKTSKYIACAFVNDNATATGTIVNNTFTDMVFGTAGSALVESTSAERFKLIGELNGLFVYTGKEPFFGLITFDFTVESSGGTVDFRFKWVKSTDGGGSFSDLDDAVESLVAVGSDAQSVSKTFPLDLATGDQLKPQITRNSGNSGITSIYATIYATQ